MRKLLLAGVAGLGAWGAVAPDASAQATAPSGYGYTTPSTAYTVGPMSGADLPAKKMVQAP